MTQRIEVNPVQLRHVADQLRTAGHRIKTEFQEVDHEVRAISGADFLGMAATHFRQEYQHLSPSLAQMSQILTVFAQQLDLAAEEFARVDATAMQKGSNGQQPVPDTKPDHGGGRTPTPAPVEPHYWDKYIGQTSKSEVWRGAGCVGWMLNSTYVPWVSDGKLAPGDAKQWLENARAWNEAHPEYQITIDQTPRPGAIAVFPGMGQGYGHVAKVESVNGSQFVGLGANTWNANNVSSGLGHWWGANGVFDGAPNRDTYPVDNNVWFIHFPWEEAQPHFQ